jgi:hypothetical protein
MKTFFTYLFLALSISAFAQSYSSPESVKYDAIHQRYIVSNTNSNNLQQVIPGSAPTLFKSGVTSPYGNVVVGDTVYVCSSGNLKGYNLTTGNQAINVALGGSFLNGICTDFAGNIFVTDFSSTPKKVYRYNIASQQHNVICTSTNTLNGIVYDKFHNRLVIATWGLNAPILGLSMTDSTITTLKSTTLSNIDGVTIDEDGNFYAASWLSGGQGIYFFDSAFVNSPIRIVNYANSTNPADIFYNTLSDTLVVPNTGNSTVRFYGFPRPRPTSDFATATVAVQQTICVLQNDLIDGNVPLSLQSFSSPQLGNATASGNCIAYTASSIGNDTIEYVVCSVDTPSFCRTGTLVVTIVAGGGNNAPVASDDTASTTQTNPIIVNVVANDFDADVADSLCVSILSLSNHFSTDSTNCQNIIYTPDSSFVGNDTCVYIVCDNGNPVLCDTGSLVVKVNACVPPDFQIIYLCGDNSPAPAWGCGWCAKYIVSGVYDSLSWEFSGLENWFGYDTTIVDRDTLFVGFNNSCGDVVIPFGFDWIVCATIQNICGSKTLCDTTKIYWEGIDEISLSNISLYPNPANNVLTIDMQNNSDEITRSYAAIEIVNVLGEKQKSISRKGTIKTVSLDVADLPNGIYLATIVSGKQERRMLGKFTINR